MNIIKGFKLQKSKSILNYYLEELKAKNHEKYKEAVDYIVMDEVTTMMVNFNIGVHKVAEKYGADGDKVFKTALYTMLNTALKGEVNPDVN